MTDENDKTPTQTEDSKAFRSSALLDAIEYEIKVAAKESELLKLRMEETGDRDLKEAIRIFGSTTWKREQRLRRVVASNAPMSQPAETATTEPASRKRGA